jgi:hypothetical protein
VTVELVSCSKLDTVDSSDANVYTPAGRFGSRHSLRDAPAVIKPPDDEGPDVVVVVGEVVVVVGDVVDVVKGGDVVEVVEVGVVPMTPTNGIVVVAVGRCRRRTPE